MCQYHKDQHADYKLNVKMEAMLAYGGCQCSWPGCDCTDLDILHIDHVNGGGNEHRRELGMEGGGYNFYLWLKNNGYPKGFRVLCANHNTKAYANVRR